MKKIIIYIILTLSIMTGCSIDRLPHGSMASDAIVGDPEGSLDALLVGSYAQMIRWADAQHRSGEYAGDNVSVRGNSTDAFFEFISYSRTADNYRLEYMWNDSYKVIAQTSNIINMIDEKQSTETDHKIGECYFLRGMMYFYLCRTFGRPYYDSPETNLGVPIVNGTPENLDKIVLPDRSTVKETYAWAIADLKKSAEMMSLDKGPAYASQMSAYAVLSRVYLYMSGTWDNPVPEYAAQSVKYADLVISSGNYSLLPTADFMKYNTMLPESNNESIFVVKRLASEAPDHANSVGGFYSNVGGKGWGEMFASAKYLDLLSETGVNNFSTKKFTDARAAFIQPKYDGEKKVLRYIIKVYNTDKNSDNYGDQTGYTYKQADKLNLTSNPKTMTTYTVKVDPNDVAKNDTTFIETYDLIPVSNREGEYTFTMGGVPYLGAIDRLMTLNNGHPQFYILKSSREGEESQLHSPVISRLAEVYLNKAEALAKQGKYGEALLPLNEIRERSLPGEGYTSITSGDAANLIDKERQLELAFQAERSYDVYRNGGTLTRAYPGAHDPMLIVTPEDNRVIYFIPQDAINAYAPNKLTQNPLI